MSVAVRIGGIPMRDARAIRSDERVGGAPIIMTAPAPEVAARYGAQPRTVVRWRNTIRDAQKAS
jgi:hypothetical protein